MPVDYLNIQGNTKARLGGNRVQQTLRRFGRR